MHCGDIDYSGLSTGHVHIECFDYACNDMPTGRGSQYKLERDDPIPYWKTTAVEGKFGKEKKKTHMDRRSVHSAATVQELEALRVEMSLRKHVVGYRAKPNVRNETESRDRVQAESPTIPWSRTDRNSKGLRPRCRNTKVCLWETRLEEKLIGKFVSTGARRRHSFSTEGGVMQVDH
ncbi:hypothetical protein FISHEDRAFT_59394 [Fistulina hepatica ATCC 64428]|uniref:Uncharacterized protein n=1 Tax=Fistulina hepatica ATCC 64428 TaxID=1128425 RepID=A0A0D7AAT4_9AGAR|nr:hypothetical protein FISHEDRAFT_59394 [Fistulina hepatica ATCC 64428]